MAEYKTIKGFNVQSYASDPVSGQIAGGTWASAPSVNTGRSAGGGAGQPSTPTSGVRVETEEWTDPVYSIKTVTVS